MRGEICVGSATLLSLTTLILLIFTHVGQINTSSVPRGIFMAKMNTSDYGDALSNALLDPINGLYAENASEPLQDHRGLRQIYKYGLYAHCGYLETSESTLGICSNDSAAHQYRPYEYMATDMSNFYTTISNAIVDGTTFSNSDSLGGPTKGAYYTILLGTICAFFALVTGVTKHNIMFIVSSTFASLTSIFLLCGATIWTVMINRSAGVNDLLIGDASNPVAIGIHISTGPGLYLLWAAFACSFASIIPYLISCCTYRG